MEDENYSEEIKIRLSPTQDKALARLAKTKQSKPATQARIAVHEMLLREDEIYRDYNRPNTTGKKASGAMTGPTGAEKLKKKKSGEGNA